MEVRWGLLRGHPPPRVRSPVSKHKHEDMHKALLQRVSLLDAFDVNYPLRRHHTWAWCPSTVAAELR